MKSTFGLGKNQDDPRLCVEEAVREFRNPKLILFFAGEKYFPEYAKILHELFPDALSIGCSSYRTWGGAGTAKDVLNVVGIEDGVVCAGGVIDKVDNFALEYAGRVRNALGRVGVAENTICVEFTCPFRRAEEYALMALNSVLLRNRIPVIGGTAANVDADTGASREAYVALNGRVYTEGCVYAIVHNVGGRILLQRENIYEPLNGREVLVTKANWITRTVMSVDHRPALTAYAEALQVPVEEAKQYFFHYPVGRCDPDGMHVTAILDRGSNDSLQFHARVHEGTRMMVMKEGDYRAITKGTVEEIRDSVKEPGLVLMFHCVARTILFEENGYLEEYQQLLAGAFPNFIGFACLGEQMGTKNFNHTMMMAVFE